MKNYEYLFATTLQQKLKPIIKGRIFVEVRRDELYVEIEPMTGIKFMTTVTDNFAEAIQNGYNTDYAAYEVTNMYKVFILDTFLY